MCFQVEFELMKSFSFSFKYLIIIVIIMIFIIIKSWFSIDLREEFFVPKESESRRYIDNFRELFGSYEQYIELVFDEPIDYFDIYRRDEIFSLIDFPQVSIYAGYGIILKYLIVCIPYKIMKSLTNLRLKGINKFKFWGKSNGYKIG